MSACPLKDATDFFTRLGYSDAINQSRRCRNVRLFGFGGFDQLYRGFFASFGTSGSLSGICKKLKEYNKNIKTVCVLPNNKKHKIVGVYSNNKPLLLKKEYIDNKLLKEPNLSVTETTLIDPAIEQDIINKI